MIVAKETLKQPSNEKFGLFFSGLIALLSLYSFWIEQNSLGIALIALGLTLLIITKVSPEKLTEANRLWTQLGHILGILINPLILSLIFFFMITPTAIVLRLQRRDVLRVRNTHQTKSHWRSVVTDCNGGTDFRKQ